MSTHLLQSAGRIALLVAAATFPSTYVASGQSQDSAPDTVAVLDRVTVTAQKREQSLQDVPLAVSAVGEQKIDSAGIDSVSDISRLVPSLEVQTNASPLDANFRVRRVGNLGNIPTFEPAVGVFIDGAFRSRSAYAIGDLFDLERVEVLRGPQSTLYGKNTTGGVVGIYTKAPDQTVNASAELTLGVIEGGNDALSTRFKGGISGPLSDTVSASISVAGVQSEEILKSVVPGGEDANDEQRIAVRGQLQWDITEQFSARFIAALSQQDDKRETEDVFFDESVNGYVAGFVLPTFEAAGVSVPCADNDPRNRMTCIREPLTSDLNTGEFTALLNYEFANGISLDSITSWDTYKFEGTGDDIAQVRAPVLKFHDTQEGESFQQELRLTSPGGQTVDWLLGAFYYDNEYRRGDGGDRPIFLFDTLSDDPTVGAVNQIVLAAPIPIPFASQGQLGLLDAGQDTEYLAAYGQAVWNISDAFSVTVGARWQEEEKDAFIWQSVTDPTPSIISLLLSPPEVSGDGLERKTDKITWSITSQWQISDDFMAYATAASGFKSGGFNVGFGALPIATREFQDEDISHYEAGFKGDLFNGRARIAGSAFMTDYDDYQDAAFVGAQFTVGNAEKAELRGFELEGEALLSDAFTADFAVSYADLSYDENTTGQCSPGRVPDSPTTPGACDLSGERPVNAPEWKASVGLEYEKSTDWGDVFGRLDWSWTDEYNTSFSADPLLIQDAYSWVSLRGGVTWDRFRASIWVENLLDEDVANFDAVLNIYTGDNSYQSFLQAPRSAGITLGWTY